MSLYNVLKNKVEEWRKGGYQSNFPALCEIMEFNYDPKKNNLRFLRKAQFEALETYWYLRLAENTPHIFALYKKIYSEPVELFNALNISISQQDLIKIMSEGGIDSIFKKIQTDDNFVKKYKLEALKETLLLTYPSYIFALAMGAGKTVLIGTIIATEFAMALECPDGLFVKNALVFAPGKTILGALKELSEIPYEKILPPRLYKEFITSAKFTYTRDGEKDIPIIKGSSYNIVVTNTEKIRIQKQTITKLLIKDLFVNSSKEDEIKQEVANRRLQTIASLPNLAVFSDEAHHTYGMKLGEELKRVRQTVNYLSQQTNLIVVVNTTGTPYYERQLLKDVVYWYGLSQGIKDGILKEIRGNIVSYRKVEDKIFVKDVIEDFFKNYKDVKIYDGSPAKIAIYFPQIEDLKEAKNIAEQTLIGIGLNPSIVLEVHSNSDPKIQDLFDNRINDPHLPYRVFLLVNKGTEGWNCPSLFATALARELKSSNNFCLQAACRCLRQIPGNTYKAKIYLSDKNVRILDSQLKETYGETLQELNITPTDFKKEIIVVRKTEIPPILLKKKIRKVIPQQKEINFENIQIEKPPDTIKEAKKFVLDLKDIPDRKGVLIVKQEEKFVIEEDFIDLYSFTVDLSSTYRLPLTQVYEKLKEIYPNGEIPISRSTEIKKQLEEKLRNYEISEEEIEVALALIKPQGFNKEIRNDQTIYVTEIIYHKENLLLRYEEFKGKNQRDFGFHYTPYNFDSNPEKDFFEQLLMLLNENPADVEDIYFTGAITDPNKTDFIFEYKGKDGKWHTYTPDFLIKKKNGKMLIIEIKAELFRDEEKEKAIKEIEGLNPDRLKYEILITDKDSIVFENINKVKEEIYRYE
ncbi:MAG: DEAD/DEAH box helicase family protein [Endomicrobia bacterium]|nr:DEAD/DEAH box helicase family protein [Endomicrobiia bacterium]